MKFITVSELRLRATQIVKEVERTGEEIVVTRRGKPVALVRFVSDSLFKLTGRESGKKHRK